MLLQNMTQDTLLESVIKLFMIGRFKFSLNIFIMKKHQSNVSAYNMSYKVLRKTLCLGLKLNILS